MFFCGRNVITPSGSQGVVTRVEDFDDYGAEYWVLTEAGEAAYSYRDLAPAQDDFTRAIFAAADAIAADLGDNYGPVGALTARWNPSATVLDAVKAAIAVAPAPADGQRGRATLSKVLWCVTAQGVFADCDGIWFPLVAALYPDTLESENRVKGWKKAMAEADEMQRLRAAARTRR